MTVHKIDTWTAQQRLDDLKVRYPIFQDMIDEIQAEEVCQCCVLHEFNVTDLEDVWDEVRELTYLLDGIVL